MSVLQVPQLNVQVDGTWKQFSKGTRLIEACFQSGKFIPHYCYHPKLSSPGNCRMCLVEVGMPRMTAERKPEIGPDHYPIINWSPRPAISCAQEISEGMAVRTNSALVQECRHGVMEFLLINHPLDCPICDQAGECRLQEFSVQYGGGKSRFKEEKVKKPKKVDIGKHIILDDERCIMCSRCVRFMREIVHENVLGFVERGGYTTLSLYPGKRLDNNYSLNTVDICPVGALTSKEFRFKMRVWFLKETKSIDVNCGTGSNILISSRENQIFRITPRENDHVNSCWLPDSHRLNFRYVNSPARLQRIILKEKRSENVDWEEAIRQAALELNSTRGAMALLASARSTNEELYLLSRLARVLEITLMDVVPRFQQGDGFLISDDGNPNTWGARLFGLTTSSPGARLKELKKAVETGDVRGLLIVGEDAVAAGLSADTLNKLHSLIVLDFLPNTTTDLASVLLPVVSFAEKRGTMINVKGRLQRLNAAIQPPGQARPDWMVLHDLLAAVESSQGPTTIEGVFRRMAQETPALAGLTLATVGDLGVDISRNLQLET
ncbi:MAG: NADH-quinone oxidoreductase subunit L [Verrucomicrobia bacterium]|nr:MAG: NADH-quinone oxidoreductase subunit L [Verrucomicrobiota bacterium]